MKNSLFREKAYKKALSPEQINDYIKTIKPGVWGILSAVIILLSAVFVWSICGKLEITITSVTVCEDGKSYCYISENDIDKISDNTYVRIDKSEYKINDISELPSPALGQISPYGLHLGNFENDDWVYQAEIETTLKDGIYKTCIVSDCVSPISLILN